MEPPNLPRWQVWLINGLAGVLVGILWIAKQCRRLTGETRGL